MCEERPQSIGQQEGLSPVLEEHDQEAGSLESPSSNLAIDTSEDGQRFGEPPSSEMSKRQVQFTLPEEERQYGPSLQVQDTPQVTTPRRKLYPRRSDDSPSPSPSPKPPSLQSSVISWPLSRRFQEPIQEQHPALRGETDPQVIRSSSTTSNKSSGRGNPTIVDVTEMTGPTTPQIERERDQRTPGRTPSPVTRSSMRQSKGLFKSRSSGSDSRNKRFSYPAERSSDAVREAAEIDGRARRQSMSTIDSLERAQQKRSSYVDTLHEPFARESPVHTDIRVAENGNVAPSVPPKPSVGTEVVTTSQVPQIPRDPLVHPGGHFNPKVGSRKLQKAHQSNPNLTDRTGPKKQRFSILGVSGSLIKFRLSTTLQLTMPLQSLFGRSNRSRKDDDPSPHRQSDQSMAMSRSKSEGELHARQSTVGNGAHLRESESREQVASQVHHNPPPNGYYAPKAYHSGQLQQTLDTVRIADAQQPRPMQDVADYRVGRLRHARGDIGSAQNDHVSPQRPLPSHQEPQYETPPIPAPYRAVSGDGGYFSSTESTPDVYWDSHTRRATTHFGRDEAQSRYSRTANQVGPRFGAPGLVSEPTGYFGLQGSNLSNQSSGPTMATRNRQSSRSPGEHQAATYDRRQGRVPSPVPVNQYQRQRSPGNMNQQDMNVDDTQRSRTLSGERRPDIPARRSKSVQWVEEVRRCSDPAPANVESESRPSAGLSRPTIEDLYKPLPPPPPPSKSPLHTHPFMPPSPQSNPATHHRGLPSHNLVHAPPSPDLTPRQTPEHGHGPTSAPMPMGMRNSDSMMPLSRSLPNERLEHRPARHSWHQESINSEKETVNGSFYEDAEEEIVMSSTAYPGQEWQPVNFANWEDD